VAALMDDAQAQLTARDYVCAQCWGRLTVRPSHREGVRLMAEVFCAAHPEHEGFVRKGWAERREQEALADAVEARYNLGAALGLNKDAPEIDPLKALGF